MPCAYLFADEAGDFKFKSGPGASRYFILCTIRLDSCEVGADLLDLRRRMLLNGVELGDKFHASSDPWPVRNEVYNVLAQHQFRVDSTILEKSKARQNVRATEPVFYQYAWFYHAKFVVPHPVNQGHDLLVTAAALETKAGRAAFKNAFNNAIQQTARGKTWATDFQPSAADPCLQAADYCAWAIQRTWELDDNSVCDRLGERIATQFELWRFGRAHYY